MKDQFYSLLECLKNIKIKLQKNEIRASKNLFEQPNEYLINFNGFTCNLEYKNHLFSKFDVFRKSCDGYVLNPTTDHSIVIREIKFMSFETEEFEAYHFTPDQKPIIELDTSIQERIQITDFYIEQTFNFFVHQKQIIQLVKQYLQNRHKYIKKYFLSRIVPHCTKTGLFPCSENLNEGNFAGVDSMPQKSRFSLRWSKDKIQLLELLSVLYDSDSVRSTTGEKLHKKHFFNDMFSVFNIEVRNMNSLLNSIKRRKSKEDSYIAELLQVFNKSND